MESSAPGSAIVKAMFLPIVQQGSHPVRDRESVPEIKALFFKSVVTCTCGFVPSVES